MTPGSPRGDIIISIHPQHVANIVSRVKNHEFRSYLLPSTVKRLWIYETSPTSSIRFIATVSQGKRPGEIQDPSGLKNDEFDLGELESRAQFAYEIQKLEELPTAYSLDDLKRRGWLNGAPQKYCFVKPAMDEALKTTPLKLVFDSAVAVAVAAPQRKDEGKGRVCPLSRSGLLSSAGVKKSRKPQGKAGRKRTS
ncbi:hypothetical protein B0T22DRAFT_132827 [Podospora appendiculata]|uniref:Uncharacterized protein n=1 Tax=Podospora appendiculata TaxID=314037 RepID=A0AAE0X8G7_9PEZI|nr:hypothetical protein B0T22DRAFT_132827 [Podospora appendiculata]